MNRCARKGYLVDASGVIPEDPTDLGVELLPVVGCSNLLCTRCKEKVTQQVSGRNREYRCACSKWTETSEHPLFDPEPDPQTDPMMPWECAGHPTIQLPRNVDGVDLRNDTALRDVAKRVLHGWHPPGARAADETYNAWLRRLYVRLVRPGALAEAALACVRDPDEDTRARAIVFFYTADDPATLAQLVPLLDERALFADVEDRIGPVSGETLEDSLWRVLEPLVKTDGALKKRARGVATTPGRGRRAIYDVLVAADPDWLVANIDAVVRANRDRVEDLTGAFLSLPPKLVKAATERARAVAADKVPRARTRAEMLFATTLVPCPKCGAPTGNLELSVGTDAWVYSGKCPSCGAVRSFQFTVEGDPRKGAYERLELGDNRPSAVIDPKLLVAELQRLEPSLRDDPRSLSGDAWSTHAEAAERAYTCAVELAKFLPNVPAGVDPAWVERERDRAITRLDRIIADSPRIWAQRGGMFGPADEVRALLAQAGIRRRPTVADLNAFLAGRRTKARVWEDASGVHAEVDGAGMTPAAVQDALLGAALPVDVDQQGDTVRKVTIHFGRSTDARR